MQEGRPLAFEIRPLKGKGLHKPIYEKEMMEILHALKKCHPYLIGRHFKVKTDHDSLKYFLEQSVTYPATHRLGYTTFKPALGLLSLTDNFLRKESKMLW
jgi:hypothetical protein